MKFESRPRVGRNGHRSPAVPPLLHARNSVHVITGEWPPRCGGVGDYTAQLAQALDRSGLNVHVWTDDLEATGEFDADVPVHTWRGGFGPSGLPHLARALNAFPGPRTLWVQYVPNAFGWRGGNLAFCAWMLHRARATSDDIRITIHEPFLPYCRQRLRRNALAAVQRGMVTLLLAASRTVYVSNPAWERLLRPYLLGTDRVIAWLPMPASVPLIEDDRSVEEIRNRLLAGRGNLLVGHFGTYGDALKPLLRSIFVPLLQSEPDVVAMFLGTHSREFVAGLAQEHPCLAARMLAPGFLPPADTSLHLQALDLCIQPYPDGVSSRRTSLMAALRSGVPTVGTSGWLTEPLWRDTEALALAPVGETDEIVRRARALLSTPAARAAMGRSATKFYHDHFAIENTLRLLGLGADPETPALLRTTLTTESTRQRTAVES